MSQVRVLFEEPIKHRVIGAFLLYNLPMSDTRSSYWDNIKGVLICLVVFAHFIYDFTDLVVIDITVFLIYVFHMPAFVFV